MMANTLKNKRISLQILLQWLCHIFSKQNTFQFIIAITAVFDKVIKKAILTLPPLHFWQLLRNIALKMMNL